VRSSTRRIAGNGAIAYARMARGWHASDGARMARFGWRADGALRMAR